MPRRAEFNAVLATPLPSGLRVGLKLKGGMLQRIAFLPAQSRLSVQTDDATLAALTAVEAYFREPAAGTNLPLAPQGTPFQRRVWAALQQIPPGKVSTYGELAHAIGSGARAVAAACRANPIPIFIPCHRVVACGGLGGYMGRTAGPELALKRWLLHHEGFDSRG